MISAKCTEIFINLQIFWFLTNVISVAVILDAGTCSICSIYFLKQLNHVAQLRILAKASILAHVEAEAKIRSPRPNIRFITRDAQYTGPIHTFF